MIDNRQNNKTMQEQISILRKIAIAYNSANVFDYCPEPEKAAYIKENYWFAESYSIEEIESAFDEHSGERPDELADQMAETIARPHFFH